MLVIFSDVIIKGNLSLETSGDEEEPESCSADEEYLADLYKEHSSQQSKQMRRELQRVYEYFIIKSTEVHI